MIVRPILEPMLEEMRFEDLPSKWISIDLESFSSNKKLWDFQQNALKNAIKCLYLFYDLDKGEKSKFYQRYVLNGLHEDLENNLNINPKKTKGKIFNIIREYFPLENNTIKFTNFINRCAFWMATGSGKTLVIVKLIEILKNLMDLELIPKKDILFLTHREELINQFKKHVDEFNESSIQRGLKINLKDLSEFEKIKRENLTPFFNEVIVFYYKADCINDEEKEKIIDFRNYENKGNWYIILDEAHRGDKNESKRQFLYSIMARNGFLFNFSATFVDISDILTTCFNFNLEKFISEGYGKHIYILKEETRAFREKEDYNEKEKKKIVLKTLILLTYIKKIREKIKKIDPNSYHEPLMLTLVNTVNFSDLKKEESDLKLFFDQIEYIGKGLVDDKLFNEAIEDLIKEFSENPKLSYEGTEIKIEQENIKKIKLDDILNYVFNSDKPGNIEALNIPEKKQEVLLKLKTSDKPFALIKIGDADKWIKENLKGYEVNESYEDKSIFERLDEKEEINILMGSRTFYEGWDSNRPNIILFINIGVGSDAKKYVLQSIGRGIRIEPIKNKRKRIKNLFNSGEDNGLFDKLSSETSVQPLETLFIWGTNKEVIEEIIKHLEIKKELETTIEFNVNPNINTNITNLLIPVYKHIGKLYLQKEPQKFTLSENSFQLLKEYFNILDDRIILISNDNLTPEMLHHIKNTLSNKDKYYNISSSAENLPLNVIISELIRHFNVELQDIEKFKKLEEEIVHFKKIKIFFKNPEEHNEFNEKIEKVKNYPNKFFEEKNLEKEYGKISKKEYDTKLEEISKKYSKEEKFKDIKIKYVAQHYYIPLIISENEKIDYIQHIIKTKSEADFINKLDDFIEKNKIDIDWWFFSKIDQTLDNVYIPYYDPLTNHLRNFYPDFIFWLKKGDNYYIIFVDPKGISHTEFEYKIDGFKMIFENSEMPKIFNFENLKIKVFLFLFTKDINLLPEGYKKYWLDNISHIFKIVT
ncbi:MAG: DEAD/DEAH box helicase family protein [Candidatus Woesearchaeota archaeon]